MIRGLLEISGRGERTKIGRIRKADRKAG